MVTSFFFRSKTNSREKNSFKCALSHSIILKLLRMVIKGFFVFSQLHPWFCISNHFLLILQSVTWASSCMYSILCYFILLFQMLPLTQCFSNMSVNRNHLGNLKHRSLGPRVRAPCSEGMGWDLKNVTF